MVILTQQQVATFPVWDGELELWQPEEATQFWPPTEDTARHTMPVETCPWTEDMVQELWGAMTQENVAEIEEARREWEEVKEFNDRIDSMEKEVVDYDAPSYFNVWDQSTDRVAFVCDSRGIAREFTPELLVQRDNLSLIHI